jgi:hypothetical protein
LSGDIINNDETPVPVPHKATAGNVVTPAVSEDLRSDEETAREASGTDRGEIAKAFNWDSEPAELASAPPVRSIASLHALAPFPHAGADVLVSNRALTSTAGQPRHTDGGVFSGHARRLTLSAAPES